MDQIRTGFDLWARLLRMDNVLAGKTSATVAEFVGRAVMVNLTDVADAAYEVLEKAGRDIGKIDRYLYSWLKDHENDTPFPVTLYWWRTSFQPMPFLGDLERVRSRWWLFGAVQVDGYGVMYFAWPDSEPDVILVGQSVNPGHLPDFTFALAYGRACAACTNVKLSDDIPMMSRARFESQGKHELIKWTTVEIPRERIRRPTPQRDETIARVSPRLHPVRRHRVRLRSGIEIRRGPFWRGDPSKGVTLHDYDAEG